MTEDDDGSVDASARFEALRQFDLRANETVCVLLLVNQPSRLCSLARYLRAA